LFDRAIPRRSGDPLGRPLAASRRSRCVSLGGAVAGLTFALTLHGAPAGAQDQALDLRAAVQYALAHNANIASRRATLANAEAQFAKDHASEYPPVVGLLQNQLTKQNNTSSGQLAQYGLAPANVFSQNTAQLGTQWTVYNGSNNQIVAQRAKRQVESDRDDLRRAEQQLTQDVNNAYWTIAVRRENVRLDSADEAYQQALLQVSRDSERVGRTAGVDVLRSQVNALRAQAALATAQSDEATAHESLAQVIGAPPEQPFVIEDELPEPPLVTTPPPQLIAAAQANRADIASAASALADARLSDSIIDTDRFPVLAINGSFGNEFSPTQPAPINFITGKPINVGGRGSPGFWQIGATETLQIGFAEYGSRHAQHRAAHFAIDSAQAALDTARYNVESDVRQALRGAQTAADNLATAKQASALGAESARIAQLQFKNGLISLTDATQAERDNLSAQNDLVNARAAYIDAIVRLRVSIGDGDPLSIVDFRRS
jgi:multidrug efflux system outer membrane protein